MKVFVFWFMGKEVFLFVSKICSNLIVLKRLKICYYFIFNLGLRVYFIVFNNRNILGGKYKIIFKNFGLKNDEGFIFFMNVFRIYIYWKIDGIMYRNYVNILWYFVISCLNFLNFVRFLLKIFCFVKGFLVSVFIVCC